MRTKSKTKLKGNEVIEFSGTLTSVRSRLRPSTSSSPALSSPPGSLKNVVPSCNRSTCGNPCSCTNKTPSTDRLIPIFSNSSRILWNRAGTEGSFSNKGSLVPKVQFVNGYLHRKDGRRCFIRKMIFLCALITKILTSLLFC